MFRQGFHYQGAPQEITVADALSQFLGAKVWRRDFHSQQYTTTVTTNLDNKIAQLRHLNFDVDINNTAEGYHLTITQKPNADLTELSHLIKKDKASTKHSSSSSRHVRFAGEKQEADEFELLKLKEQNEELKKELNRVNAEKKDLEEKYRLLELENKQLKQYGKRTHSPVGGTSQRPSTPTFRSK